jgi:hypothetical protein
MADLSDTPAGMISRLDDAIERRGQTVILRRTVPNEAAVELTIRATVRGYRPEEMTDGIVVGASRVILSATAIKGTAFEPEDQWPRKNDKVLISGRLRNIEASNPVVVRDVLVRINLQVAG